MLTGGGRERAGAPVARGSPRVDIDKIRDAAEPGVRPEDAQAAGAGGARGGVAQSPSAPAQTGAGATQAFAPAPGFDPVAAARMLEEALEVERGLLRTMIDSLPTKIYAKDTQSRFIACNWPVAREMGATPAEIIGKTDFDYFPREMAEGFFADEQAIIRSGQALIDREELVLDRVTGQVREISTTKVPFKDRNGRVIGIVGIGRDITERKRAEERIRHLATHDTLTDLPNRALFSERLNAALREASTRSTRLALLFVDLDRFKFINDSLGHQAGDALLKQTAVRLQECVQPGDIVARLGGDEFVLLCQDVAEIADVDALATRILRAVTRPVVLLDQEWRVSASVGVALYPTDGETERALMKSADAAMYTAKQDGKNNYRRFSRGMNAESLERAMLENELRKAIERRELLVHYLPKFDLKARTITGAEALLRWSHPDLGLIPPRRFLDVAEETGLIVPIGAWVLRTVCAQHAAWKRDGLPPMCVSVNLTWRQFNDEQFVPTVMAALEESGMAPNMLELEFSETLLLQHPARSSEVLRELKRAGVRLAVDNFGASYLSLAGIERFPIDTLKVDRSLLRDTDNAQTCAITDAIIAVAKSLSLTVIAEGVETIRQAAFAREHACDAMQGFYVSEPMGDADFAALLRRHKQL
jgi:diguanylate cyclase (GGDEF)-like protein/PAS domain S-box-containing protein